MLFDTLKDYGVPIWGPTRATRSLLCTGTWSGSSSEESFLRVSRINNSSRDGLSKYFLDDDRADRGIKFLIYFCLASLLGVAQSPKKFTSLDWIDQVDDMGIVAGGMEDGAITIWNIKQILDGYDGAPKMGKGCISAA